MIVEVDSLPGSLDSVGNIQELSFQHVLLFEDTVDSFSNSIIVAVTGFAHGYLDFVLFQQAGVGPAAVLDTPIRVVDQTTGAVALADCLL